MKHIHIVRLLGAVLLAITLAGTANAQPTTDGVSATLVFQSATHLPVLLVSHDAQDSVAAGGDVLELRPNHGHGRIR